MFVCLFVFNNFFQALLWLSNDITAVALAVLAHAYYTFSWSTIFAIFTYDVHPSYRHYYLDYYPGRSSDNWDESLNDDRTIGVSCSAMGPNRVLSGAK